ncbi:hypothetical protein D3C80_1987130 [compost metagenome]
MLGVNQFNDLVELDPFILFKDLFQRQLDAVVGKHMHIGLAAQHFAVYQCAIAIK